MDRISGILPQVGWSPAMAPVTAEKAPATTVEAVTDSSSSESGLGANVDTQTEADRAAWVASLLRGSGKSAESTLLANIEEAVDPDQPAGPPPTFDVSPLEAKVAELSDPEQFTIEEGSSTSPVSTGANDLAKQNVSQLQSGDDQTAGTTPKEWQTLDTAAPGQSLDLLR